MGRVDGCGRYLRRAMLVAVRWGGGVGTPAETAVPSASAGERVVRRLPVITSRISPHWRNQRRAGRAVLHAEADSGPSRLTRQEG